MCLWQRYAFFVYYLAMLLGVVCYRTCITCFSLCFLLTSGFVTTCMYNHFCFISKNLKNVIHLHVIVLSAMMFLFLFIFLWFTLMLKCSFAFCICWDIEIFGFIIRFWNITVHFLLNSKFQNFIFCSVNSNCYVLKTVLDTLLKANHSEKTVTTCLTVG